MSEEVDLEKQDDLNADSRLPAQVPSTSQIDGGAVIKSSTQGSSKSRVRIADVLSNGDLLEHLNIQCLDLSESDRAKISESINLPTENSIRLIMLDVDCDFRSCNSLIEVLKASLDVELTFWLTCLFMFKSHDTEKYDPEINIRPLEPTFCVIGTYVAKVIKR